MNAKLKPNWAYKDYALINQIFEFENGRFYILENLEHNYEILSKFHKNDFLFVIIGCFFDEWNFKFAKECMQAQNPTFELKNIIWMCNTKKQIELAEKYEFDYVFFNQNALINEDVFKINRFEHKYNLVINLRPDVIKRPWLAQEVEKLAIVKGRSYFDDRYWDLSQLNPAYINQERISANEITNLYGKSLVGGIFSEKEGACYASSEYLLCGLPVVSTICEGGRETWYTDYNSIIVNPDSYEVKHAVNELIGKIKAGKIKHHEIRELHIQTSRFFKMNLLKKLQTIIGDKSKIVEFESNRILKKIYTEKIKKIMKTDFEKLFLRN